MGSPLWWLLLPLVVRLVGQRLYLSMHSKGIVLKAGKPAQRAREADAVLGAMPVLVTVVLRQVRGQLLR